MRKDVKVIVGVGCIVLVGLLAYVLFAPHKAGQVADQATGTEGHSGAVIDGSAAHPETTPTPAVNPTPTAPPVEVAVTPTTQPASSNSTVSINVGGPTTTPSSATVGGPSTPVVPGTDSNVAVGATPAASTDWAATLSTGSVATASSTSTTSAGGSSAGLPANTLIGVSGSPGYANTAFGGSPTAGTTTPGSTSTSGAFSATPTGARTHRVQSGETLSSIAAEMLGSRSAYTKILAANPGLNPNRMRVGTVLVIPADDGASLSGSDTSKAAVAGTTHSTGGAAAPSGNTYTVKPGDSLQRIAQRLYGNSDKWLKIYEANRAAIGGDPHRLRAGMTLKLPDAPHTTTASTR